MFNNNERRSCRSRGDALPLPVPSDSALHTFEKVPPVVSILLEMGWGTFGGVVSAGMPADEVQ